MQSARHGLRVSVVAAAVAIALGACSRDERQEVRKEAKQATDSAATVIDNAALTTKVKAALLADELVKGTQINVDSASGVVTLSGSVDSAAHKDRAEQVTKGVSGVTRVQNNLTAAAPAATAGSAATPSGATAAAPRTTAPMTSVQEPPPAAVTVVPPSGADKSTMPAVGTKPMMADAAHVRQVQQQLTDRGYKPGPVDGIMGPMTREALRNFKQKEGISGSGLDDATLKALGISTSVKP